MKKNPHTSDVKIWAFDKFHALKKKDGLTQADLGKALGISQPQARELLMGERKIKLEEIPKLEKFFGEDYASSYSDDSVNTVPLISWVSAGALTQPDYTPNDWDDFPQVIESGLDPNGDWIALRVNGRSMDKISPHDSIIFVNRNETDLIPNACYIVGDGNGGATYKRWRPPNILEAVSTKPDDYEVIRYDQEPDVIGRVRKTVLVL